MAKAPKGITKSSRTCVAAFAPSAKPLTHFSKAKYSTNPYLKVRVNIIVSVCLARLFGESEILTGPRLALLVHVADQ